MAVDFLSSVHLYCTPLWSQPSCVCCPPRPSLIVVSLIFPLLNVHLSLKNRQEQPVFSEWLRILLTNSGNVGGTYKINCFNVVLMSQFLDFLNLIV